jgi:hypothetical protein
VLSRLTASFALKAALSAAAPTARESVQACSQVFLLAHTVLRFGLVSMAANRGQRVRGQCVFGSEVTSGCQKKFVTQSYDIVSFPFVRLLIFSLKPNPTTHCGSRYHRFVTKRSVKVFDCCKLWENENKQQLVSTPKHIRASFAQLKGAGGYRVAAQVDGHTQLCRRELCR